MHLTPIVRGARDIFSGGLALLVLTDVAGRDVETELLRGLFDLTAAEARVAAGLIAGRSAEDLAGAFGVSLPTVRTQIQAVLAKSGCRRQAEFVARLAPLGQRATPPSVRPAK